MRPTRYALLSSTLALLCAALLAAGCDSGGDPSEDLGQSTTFSFAEGGGDVVPEDSTGGTYELTVVVRDPGFKAGLSVDVVFDAEASTVDFSEISGLPQDTTLTFPESATDGASQTLTFQVADDFEFEGEERLVFALQNPEQGSIGAEGTFSLTIEDDEMQTIPIAEARAMADGEAVTVEGVFTRIEGINARIQDTSGTGGASGLLVRDGALADAIESGEIEPGDRLRATGGLGSFNGLKQISQDVRFAVIEEDAGVPDPQDVTLADLATDGEDYESELVRVENLRFETDADTFSTDGGDGFGNYAVTGAGGAEGVVRIPSGSFYVGEDVPEGAVTFVGVVDERNGTYRLVAIDSGALIEEDGGDGEDEGEVLLAVDFQDGELSPFTAVSVASAQDWAVGSRDDVPTSPYAEANGFNNTDPDAVPSNDWLISPALNLADAESETLTFLSEEGFGDDSLGAESIRLLVSTDYDGSGNPEDFTWTDISARATFDDVADNFEDAFQPSGEIDLSDEAFQAEEVYIAFQYRSSGTGPGEAAAWRIDDVVVREGSGDGFPEPPGRP